MHPRLRGQAYHSYFMMSSCGRIPDVPRSCSSCGHCLYTLPCWSQKPSYFIGWAPKVCTGPCIPYRTCAHGQKYNQVHTHSNSLRGDQAMPHAFVMTAAGERASSQQGREMIGHREGMKSRSLQFHQPRSRTGLGHGARQRRECG